MDTTQREIDTAPSQHVYAALTQRVFHHPRDNSGLCTFRRRPLSHHPISRRTGKLPAWPVHDTGLHHMSAARFPAHESWLSPAPFVLPSFAADHVCVLAPPVDVPALHPLAYVRQRELGIKTQRVEPMLSSHACSCFLTDSLDCKEERFLKHTDLAIFRTYLTSLNRLSCILEDYTEHLLPAREDRKTASLHLVQYLLNTLSGVKDRVSFLKSLVTSPLSPAKMRSATLGGEVRSSFDLFSWVEQGFGMVEVCTKRAWRNGRCQGPTEEAFCGCVFGDHETECPGFSSYQEWNSTLVELHIVVDTLLEYLSCLFETFLNSRCACGDCSILQTSCSNSTFLHHFHGLGTNLVLTYKSFELFEAVVNISFPYTDSHHNYRSPHLEHGFPVRHSRPHSVSNHSCDLTPEYISYDAFQEHFGPDSIFFSVVGNQMTWHDVNRASVRPGILPAVWYDFLHYKLFRVAFPHHVPRVMSYPADVSARVLFDRSRARFHALQRLVFNSRADAAEEDVFDLSDLFAGDDPHASNDPFDDESHHFVDPVRQGNEGESEVLLGGAKPDATPITAGPSTALTEFASTSANPGSVNDKTEETRSVTRTAISKTLNLAPSLDDILGRDYLLSTHTWTTSQAIDVQLSSHLLPRDAITQINTAMRGILDYHLYLRYKMEFTIQLNPSPFHAGVIRCYVDPAGADLTPLDASAVRPYVALNVGFASSATLSIPHYDLRAFLHQIRALPSQYNSRVRVAVFNMLRTGASAPTTLTYSVYVRFVDVAVGPKEAPTYLQGLDDVVSHTAALNLPVVSEIAKILGGVSGNFDNPSQFPADADNLALVDVPRTPHFLATYSSDYPSCNEFSEVSEADFTQPPCRIAAENLSTSTASGAIVFYTDTGLNLVHKSGGGPTTVSAALYFLSRFKTWRGDVEFTFEFIATKFHQGRYLLCWTPYSINPTFADARAVPNFTVDIQQTNRIRVRVPFVYHQDTRLTTSVRLGSITLFQLTPLIAPENVSNSIDLNVYFSVSPSFHFFIPEITDLFAEDTTFQGHLDQNCPNDYSDPSCTDKQDEFLWDPFAGVSRGRQSVLPKSHTLKDVLRRPFLVHQLFVSQHPNDQASLEITYLATIPVFPKTAVTKNETGVPDEIADHSRKWPFRAYLRSGSGRYIFHATCPKQINVVVYFVMNLERGLTPAVASTFECEGPGRDPVHADHLLKKKGALAIWHPNQDPRFELEVPHYSNNSYLYFDAPYITGSDDLLWPRVKMLYRFYDFISAPSTSLPSKFTVDVYFCDGDDAQYYVPLAPPLCTYRIASDDDDLPELETHRQALDDEDSSTSFFTPVFDFFHSISGLIGIISGLTADAWGKIAETVKSASETCKSFWRTFRSLSQATRVVTAISNFLPKLCTNICPLITALYSIFSDVLPLKVAGFLSFIQICATFVSDPQKQTQDAHDIERVCREASLNRQGSDDLLEGIVSAVSCRLTSLTTVFLNLCGVFTPDACHRYLARVLRGRDPESLSYFVTYLFELFRYCLYGNALNEALEREFRVRIVSLTSRYNSFLANKYHLGEALRTVRDGKPNFDHFTDMYNECQKIRLEAVDFPTVSAHNYFTLSKLEELYIRTAQRVEYDIAQAEPVGVYFFGEPGCGKSVLASEVFPAHVLPACGFPFTDTSVYAVPPTTQDYMDRYAQQPYLVFDDFLQDRDGRDVVKCIQIVNSAKPAVNMADLSEKGIEFKSHFFVASSNQNTLNNVTQINKPTAIIRRFPICYTVRLTDTYAKKQDADEYPTLDLAAFTADFCKAADPALARAVVDSTWTFHRLDLRTGISSKTATPFSTVVKLTADLFYKRKETFATLHAKLRSSLVQIPPAVPARQGGDDDGSAPLQIYDSYVAHSPLEFGYSSVSFAHDEAQILTGDLDEIYGTGTSSPSVNTLGDELTSIVVGHLIETNKTAKSYIASVSLLLAACEAYLPGDRYRAFVESCKSSSSPFLDNFKLFPTAASYVLTQCDSIHTEAKRHSINIKKENRAFYGIFGILAAAGLAATSAYLITKKFARVLSGIVPVFQAYSSTKPANKPKAHSAKTTKLSDAAAIMQEGGGHDKTESIRRNMTYIRILKTTGKYRYMHALFVDDRTLLVPTHAFVDALTVEYLDHVGEYISVHWKDHVRLRSDQGPDLDVSYVYLFGKPASNRRSIEHFFFPDVASFSRAVVDKDQRAYIIRSTQSPEVHADIEARIFGFKTYPQYQNEIFVRTELHPDVISSTKTPTVDGDCGRPYLLGPSSNTPLLGLHSIHERNSFYTCLAPITVSAIVRARLAYVNRHHVPLQQPIKQGSTDLELEPATLSGWFNESNVFTARLHSIDLKHNAPTKTALVPYTWRNAAFFHEDWKCDYLPAPARFGSYDGILFYPPVMNAQKYEPKSLLCIGQRFFSLVLDHYLTKVPTSGRLLSMHEAINGNEFGLEPLNLTTGCGFLSDHGFHDGKRQFFEPLLQYSGEKLQYSFSAKARDKSIPILGGVPFVEFVQSADASLRRRQDYPHVWLATHKDELRPEKKVLAGKCRIFEQPSLDFVLLFRRYFGDFLAWFKKRPGFTLYHSIGVDKEAVWSHYYRGFHSVARRGHAFDYRNWDGSVIQEGFEFFREVTDHFYGAGAEDKNARHTLLRMLRDGHHLLFDRLYTTSQGNKSGNPATDVFNSVVNSFVVLVVFAVCQQIHGMRPDLSVFDDAVRMLTYGDDLAIAARPDVLVYFRGPIIKDLMSHLGFEITSADKQTEIPDSIPLSDITFLKSTFTPSPAEEVVLAPLPECDILKEFKYAPKGVIGDETDFRQRLSVTRRFFAHHGEAAFCRFTNQLRDLGVPSTWISESWSTIISDIRSKQLSAVIY